MISWRMAAAWVAALVFTTVLTWQIVGLADSQVGDTPAAVAPTATPSIDIDTTTTSTTTILSTSTTPSAPTTTSTHGESPGSTDTTSTSAASTASSTSSTSSTSTTQADEWDLHTVNSIGGTIVVRYRPGEVELQAATPAPGFGVEIDDAGPPRVRVEFVADEVEARVEVRWDDGTLEVRVDDD